MRPGRSSTYRLLVEFTRTVYPPLKRSETTSCLSCGEIAELPLYLRGTPECLIVGNTRGSSRTPHGCCSRVSAAAPCDDVDLLAKCHTTTGRHKMRLPVPTRIPANAYATDLEGDHDHIPGAQAEAVPPGLVRIDLPARQDDIRCRGPRGGHADQQESNVVGLEPLPTIRHIGKGAIATGQDPPAVAVGPQARGAHIRDDERPH